MVSLVPPSEARTLFTNALQQLKVRNIQSSIEVEQEGQWSITFSFEVNAGKRGIFGPDQWVPNHLWLTGYIAENEFEAWGSEPASASDPGAVTAYTLWNVPHCSYIAHTTSLNEMLGQMQEG